MEEKQKNGCKKYNTGFNRWKNYHTGSYESPEYLQKVAAYLNQKISELSQSAGYNRLSVDTKHTLLALNIADDYFKAKSQVDTLEEDMEAKDRETYDMKHDLIAAEIQAGDLKKELEEKTNRAGTCARRDGRTAAAA